MDQSLNDHFEALFGPLLEACRGHYAGRLVSVVIYGSVGRAAARPDSDLDLLVVGRDLPDGRLSRIDDFRPVEEALRPALAAARVAGVSTELSPMFKTPTEVERGSPLFLDMIDDARILYDEGGFMRGVLERLRSRLAALGALRVWRGNAWFWDLHPGHRHGEVIEL